MSSQADQRLFSVIAVTLDRGHYSITREVTSIVGAIPAMKASIASGDTRTIHAAVQKVIRDHSCLTAGANGIETRKDRAAFNAALGAALVKALCQAEKSENDGGERERE